MQHTPGPWKVHRYQHRTNVLTEQETQTVAEVFHDCLGDEVDANARLIAAAPDLLSACKQLLAWADRVGNVVACGGPIEAVLTARRAVHESECGPIDSADDDREQIQEGDYRYYRPRNDDEPEDDNPVAACHFCKAEKPLDQAIDEGWIPSYVDHEGNECGVSTCTNCQEKHLEYDAKSGENRLKRK